MRNELILFAICFFRFISGMDDFQPIKLKGKIEIADCSYYVAGYPGEEVLEQTNTIFSQEKIATKEQLSIPVNLLFQQKNGGYSEQLPKDIGKSVQKAIDSMPVGPKRFNLIKELTEIKSNCLPTMVLPIHRLQSNRTVTAHIGKLFVLSCTVDGKTNEPILQNTLSQLKGKPAHIFKLNSSKTLYTFDGDISRCLFDLAEKGLVSPSKDLSDCLEEKDTFVRGLLRERQRMIQEGKDVTDIIEQIMDVNLTTVFDFYGIQEYRPLCYFGNLMTYEGLHFLNINPKCHVRNGYLEDFKGNSSGNIFNAIHGQQIRK